MDDYNITFQYEFPEGKFLFNSNESEQIIFTLN